MCKYINFYKVPCSKVVKIIIVLFDYNAKHINQGCLVLCSLLIFQRTLICIILFDSSKSCGNWVQQKLYLPLPFFQHGDTEVESCL